MNHSIPEVRHPATAPIKRMNDITTTMQDTIAHLRRFVVECAELRELERSLSRFNVFDVLRSAESELRDLCS